MLAGRHPQIIIRLSPSMLQVARLSGRALVAVESVDLDDFAWAEAWQQKLVPLDVRLADALRSVGASAGAAALVLHESPDAAATVCRVPRNAEDPRNAAQLLLSEVLRYPLEQAASSVRLLPHHDGDAEEHRAWLAIADSEAVLGSLAAWVQRAGGRMIGALPTQGLLIAQAAREATRDGEARLVLHVASDAAVVVGSAGGSVLFSRAIDIGVRTMVDALRRGVVSRGGTSTRDPGEVLFELGMPENGQQIERFKAEAGVNPLPLLQPLLQRYLVELKQSIRFSYQDVPQRPSEVLISGQGAALPGLAGLFGAHVELPADACSHSARYDFGNELSPGSELFIGAHLSTRHLWLAPRAIRERRSVRKGIVAIACGVAAAALGIAVETQHVVSQTRALDRQIAELAPELEQVRKEAEIAGLTAERGAALALTSRQLEPHLAARTSLAMLLGELVRMGGERIRLVEVRARHEASGSSATVEGILLGSDSGSELRDYINAVSRTPVARHAAIAWSRTATIDGQRSLRFALDVELISLPVELSLGWEGTP